MCAIWTDVEVDSFEVPVQVTPREELEARAVRLQALMRDAGVDGVMATQNADVFYLSGVIQQAQVYLPVEGKPVLMVRKHHGRSRMVSQLAEEQVVAVRSLRELPGLIEAAGGRPGRIGFELDTLPVTIFQAYQKALDSLGAELVDASMLFRTARMIKSDYEVEQIRRAASVAEAGFQAAIANLREGMAEIELAVLVEAAARAAGHSGATRMRAFGQEMHMGHLLAGAAGALPSFMNSPTGGYGPGPWAPYGAGRTPIRRGEPVFLDYSGEWGGYIADQTRMLSIGPLSGFWQDAYAAMLDVEQHLEREVRPGMTSGDVYDMALRRAESLGYGDNFMGPPEEESPGQKVPFVGHAVGLELDEWPPLQRGTTAILEAGMVLAIEPKLLYTARGAIGIEDTYLLTDTGLESLTFSSREIVVV
ncbi:MAG TPA: Xaa-Pro peptidase family protein [Chloroflexia bacterium]|nr:Xaa-Pro peptidase family protein [Chloroflexia bacterium]